jgi:hypothetical protein
MVMSNYNEVLSILGFLFNFVFSYVIRDFVFVICGTLPPSAVFVADVAGLRV